MFRQTFCAVPAFGLVEPATTSSFVFRMVALALFKMKPLGLLLVAIVRAFDDENFRISFVN